MPKYTKNEWAKIIVLLMVGIYIGVAIVWVALGLDPIHID